MHPSSEAVFSDNSPLPVNLCRVVIRVWAKLLLRLSEQRDFKSNWERERGN